MKISKKLLTYLSVGCFVVAAVIIFNMWNSAVDNRETTKQNLELERKLYSAAVVQKTNVINQIAQIEIVIKQGQEQVVQLQTDITKAEKELQKAKDQFPQIAESIEYSGYLLGFARTANLKVLAIKSSEIETADISSKNDKFYATTFTLDLEGTVTNMLSFMDLIVKDGAFVSSDIDSITFDIPVPLTQAQKDAIKAAIKAEIIQAVNDEYEAMVIERQTLYDEKLALYDEKLASTIASVTPHELLHYTVDTIYTSLMGVSKTSPMTTESMIAEIAKVINSYIVTDINSQFSREIADAIEQDQADKLIGIVADLFGQEIGAQFTTEGPLLTLIFDEEQITNELKDIPPSLVANKITELIKTRLQAILKETLTALAGPVPVEPPTVEPLDPKVVEQTAEKAAAQKAAIVIDLQSSVIETSATSTITLTVYSYKGS